VKSVCSEESFRVRANRGVSERGEGEILIPRVLEGKTSLFGGKSPRGPLNVL